MSIKKEGNNLVNNKYCANNIWVVVFENLGNILREAKKQ